jgi:hypothetical protein
MSLDEIVKACIEVLKIVAWPTVVVWLVCFFLRDEVRRAAARITEIGPAGAKFAAPPAQVPPSPPEAAPAALPSPGGSPNGHASAPGTPASVQEYISSIRAVIPVEQLESVVNSVRADLLTKAGQAPQAQIEALTYTVASLNIQLTNERIYRLIYGSQIEALALMNAEGGAPPNILRDIYERAKGMYPDVYRSYAFEQWLGFLQHAAVCMVAPNGHYILTPHGRGFLRYRIDMRLPVFKMF